MGNKKPKKKNRNKKKKAQRKRNKRKNKDRVTNYLRQLTRIKKQNSTGEKKAGKKDVFKASLNRLTQNGGGNVSALKCGSATTGSGATALKTLAEVLMKCSANVKAACDTTKLPQPDMAKIKVCEPKMKTFQTKVEECRKKTGAAACTCWNSTDLSSAATVIKNCSLS